MRKIYEFIKITEQLKKELRHSWLSDGRQESVAEHTWRMSLMLLLIEPHLSSKIDLLRAIKITIVHDLIEIYAGDIPVFEFIDDPERKEQKHREELIAIEKIVNDLGSFLGGEVKNLWLEYEENKTIESKVVKAIDKLEAQIQHNQAGIDTWEEIELELTFRLDKYTNFDKSINDLKIMIVDDARNMYLDNNLNPDDYINKTQGQI